VEEINIVRKAQNNGKNISIQPQFGAFTSKAEDNFSKYSQFSNFEPPQQLSEDSEAESQFDVGNKFLRDPTKGSKPGTPAAPMANG